MFAGVILTGVAAVPPGLALGALLSRELEAVLVLIGIAGVQLTVRPDTVISALLPLHAASPLLDAAVAGPAAFGPRLAVIASYSAGLLAIAWAAWRRRAAVRSSPCPVTPGPARAG